MGVLLRGKVQYLAAATAKRIVANAWEIRVPFSPETERLFGKGLTGLDGTVFVLGGDETEPGMISAEDKTGVTVTAWIL